MRKTNGFKTSLSEEKMENLHADRDLYKVRFEQAKEECDRLREIIKQFQRHQFGFNLSRNKLARWFIDTSKALQPLINLMKDEIIDYDVASCDPTSI